MRKNPRFKCTFYFSNCTSSVPLPFPFSNPHNAKVIWGSFPDKVFLPDVPKLPVFSIVINVEEKNVTYVHPQTSSSPRNLVLYSAESPSVYYIPHINCCPHDPMNTVFTYFLVVQGECYNCTLPFFSASPWCFSRTAPSSAPTF